jgi:hypothetical protein
MSEEIINRVAKSKLITLDLEDYYPEGERILLDIADWLYEGLILREKDFRLIIKNHDWTQYKNKYIALICSTDAIVPAWAYMLITVHLESYSKTVVLGDLVALETSIYQDIIRDLDVSIYSNKSIIIKGCSNKPVPNNAYLMLSAKLKPVAKSIMYGEACSSVPLYKRVSS